MTLTVPSERTCRAWRVFWGMRVLRAVAARDAEAFSDALACRAEWEA